MSEGLISITVRGTVVLEEGLVPGYPGDQQPRGGAGARLSRRPAA